MTTHAEQMAELAIAFDSMVSEIARTGRLSLKQAREALRDAIAAANYNGLALVPRRPTGGMLAVGANRIIDRVPPDAEIESVWQAMYDTALTLPMDTASVQAEGEVDG